MLVLFLWQRQKQLVYQFHRKESRLLRINGPATRAGQEVDWHLQKVIAGGSDGQLEEVQAETPAMRVGTGIGDSRLAVGRRSAMTR